MIQIIQAKDFSKEVMGQRKRQIILLNPPIAAIFCFTRQNGLSIYNTFVYTIFIRQLIHYLHQKFFHNSF